MWRALVTLCCSNWVFLLSALSCALALCFTRRRLLVPLGPTVRRRRLGAELRRLREGHSLKLEEVAEKLGLAASTLSRIETGKAPTKSAYLTAMLSMYQVDDPGVRKVLVDMARQGPRKGWGQIY